MNPGVQTGNVVMIFAFDAFLVSQNPDLLLKPFMMKKHGWTEEVYKEYHGHWLNAMCSEAYKKAMESLNP